MSSLMPLVHLSIEDYLEGEKISPVRHEYIAGLVYPMGGSSVDRPGRSQSSRLSAWRSGEVVVQTSTETDELQMESVGLSIPLLELYEDIW